MDTVALKAESIRKSFGPVRVLDGISLSLHAGEVHVLAGENGAGKSTLIKILAGVHVEYEGEVLLGGKAVRFTTPDEARQSGVSVIHQELSLIDSMSVLDNFFLGRELQGLGPIGWLRRGPQRERAERLCRELGLQVDLDAPVEHYPLSVKNQLEIAKALLFDSRVIIMDEPTSALGKQDVERLFATVDSLRKRGCAILYISHRMEEIYRLADRITVLRDGKSVGTWLARDLPEAELIRRMLGRELKEQFPERQARPGSEMLEVRDFRVPHPTAPGRYSVDGASLTVRAGEIVGLAGLQGSGNSELLQGIFGAYGRAVTGEIRLDGEDFIVRTPAESIRRGLALLTNDRKGTGLVLGMGIRENITLSSLHRVSPWGWFRPERERGRAEARVRELRVRASSIEQETGTLSGGNQQKVVLAKWLETSPKVLLLDEPTRGVDVGAKQEIYGLMNRLTAQGFAILLVTTDMAELLALSDRVLVMHRGRITRELARAEASAEKVLEAAMGREVG